MTQVRLPFFLLFSAAYRWRANTGGASSSWMGGEVLLIIQQSCLRAGGGRVSAHLREPRGWWRSSSRPLPQRPVSRWLTNRSFPLKKTYYSSSKKSM
ncbi:hypothetical protein Hanom_Chr05g00436081 [Helianthus anomalus]